MGRSRIEGLVHGGRGLGGDARGAWRVQVLLVGDETYLLGTAGLNPVDDPTTNACAGMAPWTRLGPGSDACRPAPSYGASILAREDGCACRSTRRLEYLHRARTPAAPGSDRR